MMAASCLIMIASLVTVVFAQEQQPEDTINFSALQMDYAHYMLIAMAATIGLYFAWKTNSRFISYVRRLHGLANDNQRFFSREGYYMAWLKRNIVNAPLFRTRHNREFQLSRAVNMGTLPSRFQAICLLGLIVMNITLCFLYIPFNEGVETYGKILRNRTGTLAVTNLIPLVILVGRNNPLIPILGLSFDTWNFFHRWIARIVALEGIIHMLSWIAAYSSADGWAATAEAFHTSEDIITGLVVRKK